jgi:hypothetical protein
VNDPHVEWLDYEFRVDTSRVQFDNPPPLEGDYDAFHLHLEADTLTVELKQHFATVESARQVVEPFLKDWMIYSAIEMDRDAIEFCFNKANIIDRSPSPQVADHIACQIGIMLGPISMQATGICLPPTRQVYPQPPTRFKASLDVGTMWQRYQNHIEGKESYQSLGYFCLSLMQWSTGADKGARGEASRVYKIDREVLDKLGELTSERGTPLDARKLESRSTLVPLSDSEKQWIRATVKVLIRRKGEYDFEPSSASALEEVTMDDLPSL